MKIALYDFDARDVFSRLELVGGVSFPILPEEMRSLLLQEAISYNYREQPRLILSSGVRQDLSGVDMLPTSSPFFVLRDAWEDALKRKWDTALMFVTPLRFDTLALQRYEDGSAGISPHQDFKSAINLICVFVLSGNCRFCLCEDRQGTNPIDLDATPGNVIILQAPGFLGKTLRPFHFVEAVRGLRISFVLRQGATRS